MRIVLVTIGRWKQGPERDLFDHYRRRCPWPIELVELVPRGRVAEGEKRTAEARLIRDVLPKGLPRVLLDEQGHDLSSPALAARLGSWRDQGRGGVCFVIGGADGLDRSLAAEADLLLALGRLTWPHLLVRALLAEQLYRASTILAGHPYHRE